MTTADDTMPEITEYDEKGNMIHLRTSKGVEAWWEYDANNNEIHYRDSNGVEEWIKYIKYDAKGNVIFRKKSG